MVEIIRAPSIIHDDGVLVLRTLAHEAGALRTKDLKRVTVDTTVQPKAISFPTDAKLLHAAIRGLARLARKHGVKLRQSYQRIAKRAAMMAGAMLMPSSSSAIIASCASCAHGSAASSATSAARSKGSRRWRRHSPQRCRGQARSARSSSASAAGTLSRPRPRGRMHRQGQGPRALRVRRQSLDRHHQCPRPRWSVRAARHGVAGQSI